MLNLLSVIFMTMALTTPQINELNEKCYDTHADRWLRFPFEEFFPHWIQTHCNSSLGNRALEIGSGNGILAEWLQQNGFEVLCLDPSSEMVRRCRAKKLKTVQTTIQDFQTQETFPTVFAILSLIHVPKAEVSVQFEKIARLIPPRGMFYLALVEGTGEGLADERFFAYYQKDEILSLLSPSFDLVEFTQTSYTQKHRPATFPSYLLFAFRKKDFS